MKNNFESGSFILKNRVKIGRAVVRWNRNGGRTRI